MPGHEIIILILITFAIGVMIGVLMSLRWIHKAKIEIHKKFGVGDESKRISE